MNLDVLIPSLFLPAQVQTPIPSPVVPALEKLLARADQRLDSTPAVVPWLCERWGVVAPYAIAPLLAEYDGLDLSGVGWMFAEPVHLIADRDRLTMFSSPFLDVNTNEAANLVASLNAHFADRHLQFFAPGDERWYVRCEPSEIPHTTSPNAARTGSLVDFQPKSNGKLNWRSLQNEVQMLFFDHPVNAARESAGKPAISGVWFWGGGVLPALKKPAYDHVCTHSAFAAKLAKKSGIEVSPPSWDSIRQVRGNVLAVVDSCTEFAASADFQAWGRELERLDREWFRPISQAIGKGTIQCLSIYVPGNGSTQSFHVTHRQQMLRFWRATKPLSSYA